MRTSLHQKNSVISGQNRTSITPFEEMKNPFLESSKSCFLTRPSNHRTPTQCWATRRGRWTNIGTTLVWFLMFAWKGNQGRNSFICRNEGWKLNNVKYWLFGEEWLAHSTKSALPPPTEPLKLMQKCPTVVLMLSTGTAWIFQSYMQTRCVSPT